MPSLSFPSVFLQQILLALAATICLFGTWVGMRHFARGRVTVGTIRLGWLLMASIRIGTALWAATFLSILALDPNSDATFALGPTAYALVIGFGASLAGLEIGSRTSPRLAPEIGGLILGLGVLAMHAVALHAWQIASRIDMNWYAPSLLLVLALGLSALSVNRANRPLTRFCRHSAAFVMTATICIMHITLSRTMTVGPDATVSLLSDTISAKALGVWIGGAVLLALGSGFSACLVDQRSRNDTAAHLQHLSFSDALTGLPNRAAFDAHLATVVADAHEIAHRVATFAIDLDGFKLVNDIYGHSAGDALLAVAAERMRGIVGPGEFLARLSGDAFLALQMSGDQPRDAEAFARKLSATLSAPFQVQDQQVTLSASIGYSIFQADTRERDQMVTMAKIAMRHAKATRRGTICAYQSSMENFTQQKHSLACDLVGAVARGEIALHYQLQTSLNDGAVVGVEALMRWTHPTRGAVSPGEFIPLAEENETIVELGRWALHTACHDAAAGLLPGRVAVNLSPVQVLRDDVVAVVKAALDETGLPPSRLEIEVTESTLMHGQQRILETLRALKALGVSVAMDDFGTGYSSLAMLHIYPFDKIKLDQSFVRRLPGDRAAAAIVSTVLTLGRTLEIPVLAEGIETVPQWDFLNNEGCARGQGYLFSKPVPVEALPAAIAAAEGLARESRTAPFESRADLGVKAA